MTTLPLPIASASASTSSTRVPTSAVVRALGAAACAAAFGIATPSAMAVTDPAGDFLATFAGSSASTDLDVLSASVVYNPGADTYTLQSTMSGPIGLTPTGFFVWGVNRGAGTAAFAANGLPDVLFDSVVLLRPGGVSAVAGVGSLPSDAVTFSGNTLTAVVSGSLLPSTGFGKADYLWNLWPRDGAFTGFAAIADFAPDTTDFATTTLAVPEPSTYALMFVGLAAVGWSARRRQRD